VADLDARAYLRDALHSPSSWSEVIEGTLARGLAIEALLAAIPDAMDDYVAPTEQAALIEALVEHAGHARAQELASATEWLAHLDVVQQCEAMKAWRHASELLDRVAPIEEVLVAVRAVTIVDSSMVYRLMGATYPLSELARLEVAAWERRALRLQVDPWALLRGRFDAEPSLLLSELSLLVDVEKRDDPGVALLESAVRLRGTAPMRELLEMASCWLPQEKWLPLLRTHELRSSIAVLHLREHDGLGAAAAAHALLEAGYSDEETFEGLLANGVASTRSLRALRENDWSAERMLDALVARGDLPPEIRTRLDELGVARHVQARLARERFDLEVVALVWGSE
jgi:hypothetical protein